MTAFPTAKSPGKLAENVLHFARALRKAGLPVGPADMLDAVHAVEAAGFSAKPDFYHTLRACLVRRREHIPVFDQCFRMFWRDPQFLERMMGALMPEIKAPPEDRRKEAAEKRAAEALVDGAQKPPPPPRVEEEEKIEFDTSFTFSMTEKLAQRDFEQMRAAEIRAAEAAIAQMRLPVRPLPTRRHIRSHRGRRPDWRGAMRAMMRPGGGDSLPVKARREEWPNLVVLCDISGSMTSYSRMLLHFLHSAAQREGHGWAKVHAFTIGTKLTNITRSLMARDPDQALEQAGREALDWDGGTRIGPALREFNRLWARRVLGRGATVLLITDGLDRADPEMLRAEARRLRLGCRRLIWLNPLLRWEEFEPKARGVRALLGEVDSFRAAHSLASLQELADALSSDSDSGVRGTMRDKLAALERGEAVAAKPGDAGPSQPGLRAAAYGMTRTSDLLRLK